MLLSVGLMQHFNTPFHAPTHGNSYCVGYTMRHPTWHEALRLQFDGIRVLQ